MEDTIYLKVFATATVIFGLAGILTGSPVYLGIAALALSNLIGSLLLGGEQLGRRRRSPDGSDGRTDRRADQRRS